MTDLMLRDAEPRYDDPTPLGGSFVLSCADVPDPATGPHPIVQGQEQHGVEGRAARGHRLSSREQRKKMRSAVVSLCDTILLLLTESLEVETRAEWHAYWDLHLSEFDEMVHSLTRLATRLGLGDKAKEKEATQRDKILERFPEAAGELGFIRSIVDDGYGLAHSFSTVPVSPDKSAADFEACGRFHFFGAIFAMCMLTLDYIADENLEVSDDVLGAVFEQARHAAFKFNHAVMTGASLRESHAIDHEPVAPIFVPDGDLEDVELAIRKYEAGGLNV